MGSRFSLLLAEFFMNKFEKKMFKTFNFFKAYSFRCSYVNDVISLFKSIKAKLDNFCVVY